MDAVPAGRMALVNWARDVIAQGSQSFATASRLFAPTTRERTWLIYSWCRMADDMTDGQVLGHGAKPGHDASGAQAALETRTDAALNGEAPQAPAYAALQQVVTEVHIPHEFVHDHVDGFALDAEDRRPKDTDDLLRYCYHVAGAVGCMMAVIMGVDPKDDDTLDRASDLGLAFQLANIARDIVPDAIVGRCYLPSNWLREYNLTEADIKEPANRHLLAELAQRLVNMAAHYRASARVGAARLPLRSRLAVLGADAIYGAIGEEVARRGRRAWDERVRIGRAKKLALFALAVGKTLAANTKVVSRDGLWTRPRQSPPAEGLRS